MALGLGGKSAMWMPMASTIVWGLSVATILTLFVIPAFYAITDDVRQWRGVRVESKNGELSEAAGLGGLQPVSEMGSGD